MPEGETPTRYIIATQGDQFLVIDMPRKNVAKFGKVLAVCDEATPATKIVAALEMRFPATDVEEIA